MDVISKLLEIGNLALKNRDVHDDFDVIANHVRELIFELTPKTFTKQQVFGSFPNINAIDRNNVSYLRIGEETAMSVCGTVVRRVEDFGNVAMFTIRDKTKWNKNQ